MLLTLTMNPSVDIAYQLDTLNIDTVNRVPFAKKTAGGKGLNVTRVLHQFDLPVMATGLLGGALGQFIEEQLDETNTPHDFFHIKEDTRNCIAMLHDHFQTEILEAGPKITEDEAKGFMKHFNYLLDDATIVSISGSLPKGLPDTYYQELIDLCANKNVPVILDSSGDSLKKSLEHSSKPFLIKPNTEELSELLNRTITDDIDSITQALNDSIFDGIDWLVVSRGANGAIAKFQDTFFLVKIPTVNAVNPVGSGDSTVAGLVAGISQKFTPEKTLKHACTLGVLNAMEETTGHVNLEHYDTIFKDVSVSILGGK